MADNELPKNYPGNDIIGKGYNVFGQFANNKSIQPYPLFDFSKMSQRQSQGYTLPKRVFLKEVNEHIIETVEGSSVSEYVSNLSQDAGLDFDAFVFKASFEDHFDKKTENNSSLFYYTYMDLNTKWQVSLDSRNIDTLKNYLDSQFKADLKSMSPESLFREYGTHFISSAYIGGRIDYSSTTQTTEESVITEVKTAIGGKYKALSGELSNEEIYDAQLRKYNTSTRLSVVGGAAEFTRDIKNHQQYEDWAASLTNKPALCGFDNRSLKPIWLLCSNPTRAKQLEDYFNNSLLTKHPLPIYFERDPILDNNAIVQRYSAYLVGFQIIKDCDYPGLFDSDGRGEFQYGFFLYVNGNKVDGFGTASDRQHTLGDGEFLTLNRGVPFDLDFKNTESIKIQFWLQELGLENQVLGNKTYTIQNPYEITDFSNYESGGERYLKFDLYHSSACSAQIFFKIAPVYDETAQEFGNAGWEYFVNGDYDNCLKYSKEALKINPGLWYAQYNVALVYLVTGNPSAFEKYKYITSCVNMAWTVKAAYKDIVDYEKKHGELKGSEEIKLLLESNF